MHRMLATDHGACIHGFRRACRHMNINYESAGRRPKMYEEVHASAPGDEKQEEKQDHQGRRGADPRSAVDRSHEQKQRQGHKPRQKWKPG
eukprot:1509064-Pleurochrysis_carterae.AAC.2